MDFNSDPQDAAPLGPRYSGLADNLQSTRDPGPASRGVSSKPPHSRYPAIRALGLFIAATWILGGTLFFLLRFSFVFYYANKDSIDAALDRLLH
jgi:hypothetical protein